MILKKGTQVKIISGKDKGKTGEVLSVLPAKERLLVRGVNIVKRHTKPSQTAPGGIVERESAVHLSNVALIDPTLNKATKIGFRILEDGRKVRFSKSSNEILDA